MKSDSVSVLELGGKFNEQTKIGNHISQRSVFLKTVCLTKKQTFFEILFLFCFFYLASVFSRRAGTDHVACDLNRNKLLTFPSTQLTPF
jgi:hypothetical protein